MEAAASKIRNIFDIRKNIPILGPDQHTFSPFCVYLVVSRGLAGGA